MNKHYTKTAYQIACAWGVLMCFVTVFFLLKSLSQGIDSQKPSPDYITAAQEPNPFREIQKLDLIIQYGDDIDADLVLAIRQPIDC